MLIAKAAQCFTPGPGLRGGWPGRRDGLPPRQPAAGAFTWPPSFSAYESN